MSRAAEQPVAWVVEQQRPMAVEPTRSEVQGKVTGIADAGLYIVSIGTDDGSDNGLRRWRSSEARG